MTTYVVHPGTGTYFDVSEAVLIETVLDLTDEQVMERAEKHGEPVPSATTMPEGGVSVRLQPREDRPQFTVNVVPTDEGIVIDVLDDLGVDVIESFYIADRDIEEEE
jgi:hypothetical protein